MPELADRLLADGRRWQTALDQLPDGAVVRPDPVSLAPPVPRRERRSAGAATVLAAALAVAVLVAGAHLVRDWRQAGSPAAGVAVSPAPTHLTSPAPSGPAVVGGMTLAVRAKLLSVALQQARMLGGGPNVTAAAVLSTTNQVIQGRTSSAYGSAPVWLVQVYGSFVCEPSCFTVSSALTAHILTLFVDRLTFATDGFRLADAEPLLGAAVNLRTGAVLTSTTAAGRLTYRGPVTEPSAVDGTPLRLEVPASRAPRLTPQQAYTAFCAQQLAIRESRCTNAESSTDITLANLSTPLNVANGTPAVLSYLITTRGITARGITARGITTRGITTRGAECLPIGGALSARNSPSGAAAGAESGAGLRPLTCTVIGAVDADTGRPTGGEFAIPAN